jgi:hypothetical protein
MHESLTEIDYSPEVCMPTLIRKLALAGDQLMLACLPGPTSEESLPHKFAGACPEQLATRGCACYTLR